MGIVESMIFMVKKIEGLERRIGLQESIIDDLLKENKGYKDANDRLNQYIKNYEVAIHRFNESNRGN